MRKKTGQMGIGDIKGKATQTSILDVFCSEYFHEIVRMRRKSGYLVILKCIECGVEGQNNVLVCARLIKIEEAIDEFKWLYSKLEVQGS